MTNKAATLLLHKLYSRKQKSVSHFIIHTKSNIYIYIYIYISYNLAYNSSYNIYIYHTHRVLTLHESKNLPIYERNVINKYIHTYPIQNIRIVSGIKGINAPS